MESTYGLPGRRRYGRRRRLAIDPVRHLHQEAVVRPQIEQVIEVAAEAARAFDPRRPLAARTPHEEERRPRPVLPAEYHVRAELLEVESADVVGVRRVAVGQIAGGVIGRARIRRQLTYVAERALGNERLRVHLERHVRRKGIGDPQRQRELPLLEVREQIMSDVGRILSWPQRLYVVGAARETRRERRGDAGRDLEIDLGGEAEALRPPTVAPKPVEPEVGHDRFAVEELQSL